ncbi:MAG: TonB-dependent receptor [Bacteroidia bacterium]|nr:TonB-dependent receptor [Bacteroidia bacterium]
MKFKYLAGILPAFAIGVSAYAQVDTAGIYGEKRDSLEAGTVVARQAGNYLPKGKDIRTEVITAAGLCKMACCNLAESFENSASVTVGYSDAVTGARQIRLLGQSGVYTQMLDENRPVMRGLSAPWGLNYVPGQWLESIQIAKGVTSVINGVESMTGQINMEHRKPTDEKPLYVTASYMNDTKADLNVISALQLDELSTWSTVILAHVDGNFKAMDHNGDGFMDDPRQLNFALSNRWLYFGQDGVQVRFGVRAIQDSRTGGQMEEEGLPAPGSPALWRSNIFNRSLNGYVKVGVPITENGDRSVAAVLDYTYQNLESSFGNRRYDAGQHTAFANLMYQNLEGDTHHFTLGISEMLDIYNETGRTVLSNLGAFGEYTFHDGEVFSAIVGLRGEWYNRVGFRFSPRLTLKWQPADWMVLRANGGRGLRYSTPLIDNIGVLSTSKELEGDYTSHPLEDSWTFGGNATWYLPFGSSTYVSLDYFHTRFTDQMLVDYASDRIRFYTLGSIDGGRSFTNNVQVDFSSELFDGFTLTLTGRYTDARQSLLGQADDVKPMVSKYKGVLNLQYATHLNKWIFDFTASVNGPCKVWDFMKDLTLDGAKPYASGYTPAYPLLYAQVTRRFKGIDLYVGGENLTNYRQPSPIIGAENPFGSNFDASCVWGPLMGIKIYGGIRLTIWKT